MKSIHTAGGSGWFCLESLNLNLGESSRRSQLDKLSLLDMITRLSNVVLGLLCSQK
jgi:hypothetical protein